MPIPALIPQPRVVAEVPGAPGAPLGSDVVVEIDPEFGSESYALATTPELTIRAGDEVGVLRARATLAQLELGATDGAYPAVRIEDSPRSGYRGFMLDVARHFYPVETVRELLDLMAELKLNVLHLHLTDDQGWRIEITSHPALTDLGAQTQCGGATPAAGGFYTRADYRAIQDHAASLGITVVPEIDVPGHTNAALLAHPELAVAGFVPEPYEGTEVGFSQLDATNEATYEFLTDVVGQLAGDTDGPYLHLGGDETHAMAPENYRTFLERAFAIVADAGKTPMAWHEAGCSDAIPAGTVGQYWNLVRPQPAHDDHFGIDHAGRAANFVRQGGRVILSPSDAVYLDHHQGDGGPDDPGVAWSGGPITLRGSYEWEPSAVLPELAPEAILGIEAALWTELVATREEVLRLALPRLAAIAEVAWSPAPAGGRRVADLAPRLRALGAQWERRGLPFTRSSDITWEN